MYKLEQHFYYKHKEQSTSINYCEHKKQILN